MAKVSIITPCYNADKFLFQTYKSVRVQSYTHWEWIVMDDCSTDDSFETLKEFAKDDKRVKVFKNEKNLGAAITRNKCLEKADGDFYAFLDADDVWSIRKLELQIDDMFEKNLDFSYHDYQTINTKTHENKEFQLASTYGHHDLLKFNPFATSSVMVRAKVITENQITFKDHLRRKQDYLFWYECMLHSKKIEGIPQFLSFYRLDNHEPHSVKKLKMAFIQWKLYREEFKLNFLKSFYYLCHYGVHGIRKYFF